MPLGPNLPTSAGAVACGLPSGSNGITPNKTDDGAATCRALPTSGELLVVRLQSRPAGDDGSMTIAKSVLLFILAAAAEIGGAWLVWQAVREGRSWWWAGLGVIALGIYGFVATLQPDAHFGRILAAYGGVFVAGPLPGAWFLTVSDPTAGTSSVQQSAWRVSPSSCSRRGTPADSEELLNRGFARRRMEPGSRHSHVSIRPAACHAAASS